MRPRGADSKLTDFPWLGSENPNPAIRYALYAPRNGAQIPGQLWRDTRPAQLPERQFHAHAPGKSGSAGRTNGLPWDTTSPCTVSTHVEIGKSGVSRPQERAPRDLEGRLCQMWAWPTAGLVLGLLDLANEIQPYSGEVAGDVRWLAQVVWILRSS
jgi:hypothetical protein